jgi:HPt (histidine-containing phosphotransfer) domain-containing protein
MQEIAFTKINLDYLDLMTDGDSEMRTTMLEMLLDEIPSEMEKMKAAWQKNDLADIKEISHKMKSTLAFVGSDPLTEANKAVEQVARGNGKTADFAVHFAEIDAHLPAVLEEISLAASN